MFMLCACRPSSHIGIARGKLRANAHAVCTCVAASLLCHYAFATSRGTRVSAAPRPRSCSSCCQGATMRACLNPELFGRLLSLSQKSQLRPTMDAGCCCLIQRARRSTPRFIVSLLSSPVIPEPRSKHECLRAYCRIIK